MSRLQIIIFCTVCLLLGLGSSALLFPYAAMPAKALTTAHTPQPMEDLPDIDLGPDYGTVPVTELVGYYIDHPPAPRAAGTARHEEQFGGC